MRRRIRVTAKRRFRQIKRRLNVWHNPWQVFVRTALLCVILGVALSGVAMRKIQHLPIDTGKLEFDAKRAHGYMWTLAKKFPNRVPWDENKTKAAEWIKKKFRSFGYEPQVMGFSNMIAGKRYTNLENIYAEKKGSEKPHEIIMVVGHYDSAESTYEGAMDDASGVAVVMELARIFARKKPRRTMIFLATDSEEFGAFWGARTFARQFERKDQIIAAANFDFVGAEEQVAILQLNDGLKSGYTPLWLREMALDSLRSIGDFEVRDFMNILEFLMRALLIPPADHGAFLQAGIPSFNWVGQNKDFSHQMAHYHHTKNDVAEIMQVRSFRQYGGAAERFMRSLDSLPNVPKDFRKHSYLKVSETLYLDGWLVTILQLLAFIPFILYAFAKFRSTFKKAHGKKISIVFRNEAKQIGIWLGSFLMGYSLLRLLPSLDIVTQYELFPATQKSPILYNPNFWAMALVVLFSALVYWVLKRTFYEPEDDEDYRELRHGFHALVLTLVIILAFIANSYLATMLLVPPTYFWMMIKGQKKLKGRLVNGLLLLGGLTTFIIMALAATSVFHLGVFYWWVFLGAAYGLISVYSVVLFFMAVTVGIRLFRSFVSHPS